MPPQTLATIDGLAEAVLRRVVGHDGREHAYEVSHSRFPADGAPIVVSCWLCGERLGHVMDDGRIPSSSIVRRVVELMERHAWPPIRWQAQPEGIPT